MDYLAHYADALDDLARAGRLRSLSPLEHVGGRFEINGDTFRNFSSNDYLNLASDPRLKRAACDAVDRYGTGATASRLMAGNLDLHESLERALAELVGQPSALVFATGYQMNVGVMSGLFDAQWTIFSDALNHASIVDGCRLSRADVRVFPHNDVDAIARLMSQTPGYKAIVVESVFSMDGDLAPLTALHALAREHGAMLIVDEAHAIGINGNGGGVCRELGILPDITLGTLGKSLGSAGGFAACSELLRDVLINRARPMIFSTGLAPACAGAALEAVRIVRESPHLGRELLEKSARLRAHVSEMGIDVRDDASPIIPIIVGDDEAAVALSEALREQHILAKAVRPPTVPQGTSRLRLSITLAHTESDINALAEALARATTARV